MSVIERVGSTEGSLVRIVLVGYNVDNFCSLSSHIVA
jgi:hypothetical protein